jgi:uncharacterized cupin superfamily protein
LARCNYSYDRAIDWFVLNARETEWRHRPGRGHSLPLTGWTDEERKSRFPQLGMQLVRLEPGEPVGMYHWEADQEGFLVLSGEALLLVEGEERPLRQWDFVHCPAGTRHVFVGAGDGPCAILMIGARNPDDRIEYPVSEVAARHDASAAETTNSGREAYRDFPPESHDERFTWPLMEPGPEALG